ncbi:DUF4136 domain-containing protein [Aestuariibacter halophilus]|uniref:DUF4136 domain-containing protein n=1 Tax=Fluctibacter halophilus TaxID=226011 RepID=A0ABS8G3D0_9ALTE|nr:DUF4136 domain-containing protein [Aestuariibacter halophilus]MCC2615040.1 DUF4136 domain-containing protein [Aestuariibacter halophilus]
MKYPVVFLVLAMLSGLMGGCSSTPTVRSSGAAQSEIAASKTYAFIDEETLLRSNPEFPEMNVHAIDAEIREALISALSVKGFTKVDATEADLLIGFAVSAEQRSDIYEVYLNRRFAMPPRALVVNADDYIEGGLIVDIFSAKRGLPLWHGWAKQRFFSKPSEERRKQTISDAVSSIITGLPDSQ